LPLASMTNPPVNWGYPRTVEGFFYALSRGQFERVHPTGNVATFLKQIWLLLLVTGKQFGWLYLGLALVPVGLLRWIHRTGRRWLLALLVMYICVGFGLLAQSNPPSDRNPPEVFELYFPSTSSFVILAVLLGLGLIVVGAKFADPSQANKVVTPARENTPDS
ncbi:MAG TPA: hypothetical protein VFZ59_02545, partial [Verrucomicrobiae bacterium]|nr:hypothetical protein [Verrucomicrobiae bacterium]